jgi:hypothetical protein
MPPLRGLLRGGCAPQDPSGAPAPAGSPPLGENIKNIYFDTGDDMTERLFPLLEIIKKLTNVSYRQLFFCNLFLSNFAILNGLCELFSLCSRQCSAF